MTTEEALQRKQELAAEREAFKANQQRILSQVLLDPATGGKGQPVGTLLTKEQAIQRKNQLQSERQALLGNQDQPMAAKASTPGGPGMMSQIADTAFGLTFPGQLYNQYKQQQALLQEIQTPGEVPPAVAAVRSGLNTATFGNAPKLVAAMEAPFTERTYPELKAQYEQYYGQSAKDRPAASMLGSELMMQALTRGMGKFIPSSAITQAPSGFFKTALKTGGDLARGGALGGLTGVAGTYGVAPSEDVPFVQRLLSAIPSAVLGGVAEALPRTGSLIGREEANRNVLMKPYEAEIQKRRSSQAAALQKAGEIEKKIPEIIRQKDVEYSKLKENPDYYQTPVNLSDFFKKLDEVKGEIGKQSKAGITTQSKQEFLDKVEGIKENLTQSYGAEKFDPYTGSTIRAKGPKGEFITKKEFQAEQIPFSEAHAIQEVINESFGGDNLMGKLRKPLDAALSNVENPTLSDQFKKAKETFQKQKQAQRFVKRKGKPEGLPEERVYKPKMPESEMPASARSIADLIDFIPFVGSQGKKFMEGAYMPRLAPTASETIGKASQPYIRGLGDIGTLLLISHLGAK